MTTTKRERQSYNKGLITFASFILWMALLVIGAREMNIIIYLIGVLGTMFSGLAMFWFGHCLGWEQKRIEMMSK